MHKFTTKKERNVSNSEKIRIQKWRQWLIKLTFSFLFFFWFVEKEKENWESSWSYHSSSSSSSTQQNPFWFVLLNNSAFLALKYEKECMHLVTPKASKYFDPNKRRTTVSVCILLLYYYYYYYLNLNLNLNWWEREREREIKVFRF